MSADSQVLDALLSCSDLAVICADLTGAITRWSAGATVLYGWNEAQALGQPLAMLTGPDQAAEHLELLASAARDRPVCSVDTSYTDREGQSVPVSAEIRALRSSQGKVIGTLSIHRDQRAAARVIDQELPTPVLRSRQGRVDGDTPLATQDWIARFETALEIALETMPLIVFSYDLDGRCTSSRGGSLRLLGLAQDQLNGKILTEVYALWPQIVYALHRSLEGEPVEATVEMEGRTWTIDYRPLRDEQGTVFGGVGIATDVTAAVQSERDVGANQARLRSLLGHASDVAVVVDVTGRVAYLSPAALLQFGYTDDQMVGKMGMDYVHLADRSLLAAAWRQVRRQPEEVVTVEVRIRHADRSWRWAEHVLTNLVADPAVAGVVANVRETTERRRVQQELERLAVQDGLTGLANRVLLLDRITQALAWGHRSDTRSGVVVLDVVGMSGLNARLGQQGGDVVLQEIARSLKAAVRPTDSVARIGADEFAVLFEEVASVEELRVHASALVDCVQEPLWIKGVEIQVRLEAGSALSPARDAGALLAAAQHSLHFRPPVSGSSPEPAAEEGGAADLRRGIAAGELRLYFQPLMHLRSGQVVGVEALVRWQHPQRGLVPPSEFIELAERTGLIVELGEWVLREGCRVLAEWKKIGRLWGMGVNLSPRQLLVGDFPGLVRDALQVTGAPANQLVIEVTESTLMDESGATEMLESLRRLGVRLALDDFGTGYSSLTYLKRFTVDAIKIDKSFVAGLGRDPEDDAIVASIVSLARAIGKIVVAEGVENVRQIQALRKLGVDEAQGFFWTPALSLADLEVWVQDVHPLPPMVRAPLGVQPQSRVAPVAGSDHARILELRLQGASLHTMTAALNREGRRAPSGLRWTTTSVARLVVQLTRPDPSVLPYPGQLEQLVRQETAVQASLSD